MPQPQQTARPPLMLKGQLASSAVRDGTSLAQDFVARLAHANPSFKPFLLGPAREDLVKATAEGLRMATRLMDHRQLPSDRDLEAIHNLTVKQAHRGVPLSTILNMTDAGVNAFRNLILSQAGNEDSADLRELNQLLFMVMQRLHTFVSVSYCGAIPTAPQTTDESSGAIARTILDGGDPTQLALQLGVDLASSYLVLLLAVNPPHTDLDADGGAHRRVQAHRDLAAAQSLLAAHSGGALLAAPHPHRGLVLIGGSPPWESICEILRKIEARLNVKLTAIGEHALLTKVPAAAATTRELARLVGRLGLPPGSYRMADLSLEYQLTREGPGRECLASMAEPLQTTPELLQTLSVHLANNQQRQRTASALGLHTNTVDNRLKRIAQLTGLDPNLPSELLKLRAAMIALTFTRIDKNSGPPRL